jgi:Tol biopolymer transport system component/DNA-binding winged helix-turn-helix (wHTH) protein
VAISTDPQFEFGPFRLDRIGRLLLRDGHVVALAPKTFDLLTLLAQNPGRAMSKTEIIATLWPETAVEEGNLSFQISTLRKALGPEASKWVETVPRHGYRFRAPAAVEPLPAAKPVLQASKLRMWAAVTTTSALVLTGAALLLSSREPRESVTSAPLTAYIGSATLPAFSPNGRAVAFMWDNGKSGAWNIYVKLLGVEDLTRFTSAPQADFNPAWSPDGNSIAFARRGPSPLVQYIVKPYPDGPEHIVMTAQHCLPTVPQFRVLAWHPDGKHLIVTEPEEGHACGLVALSIAAGTITRLTDPQPGQRDFAPAVSPDGRKLAFVRGLGFPDHILYAIPLSRNVNAAGPAWKVTTETAHMEMAPAWTPDSQELVYERANSVSDAALFRVNASGGATPRPVPGAGALSYAPSVSSKGSLAFVAGSGAAVSLWSVKLPAGAGGKLVLSEVASSSHRQQSAAYSPDGQRIVFESERSGKNEIWVVKTDGSLFQQLTDSRAIAQTPAWSPDGTQVAFTATLQGKQDLYVVGSEGGTPRRLTDGEFNHASPAWSQDGRWLYFQSNRSGDTEVWKLRVETGIATQITRGGGGSPRESPDGMFLYYRKQGGLWKLPVDGGPESLVLENVSPINGLVPVDGGIYFIAAESAPTTNETPQSKIRFHDFTTGQTQDVAAVPGPLGYGFSVSRDRRQFLVTRRLSGASDLRYMRRF